MNKKLSGVITVLCTPFRTDGTLDLEAFRGVARLQLRSGVQAIAALGLASESYKLTSQERIQIVRTLVEEASEEVPVMAGAGGESAAIAVDQALALEGVGVDAVLVTPPLITKMREADIYHYYARLVARVSVPIMIQDASGIAGPQMSTNLLIRMHQELGIEYVKIESIPAGPKIAEVISRSEGQLKVFSGYGGMYLYDALERGISGIMPGCDLPEVYVQIWKLYQAGDQTAAWSLFKEILPLIVLETQNIDVFVWLTKKVLHYRGLLSHPLMRPPGIPDEDPLMNEKVKAVLKQVSSCLNTSHLER